MPPNSAGRSLPGWVLPVTATSFYLLGCFRLIAAVRHWNQGNFVYLLDDTYIHLALAQSIAHGTYGINPGEAASPSSSLLWPLLLAPFARLAQFLYVPLAWNLFFGSIAAALCGSIASRWPRDDAAGSDTWRRAFSAVVLLFVGNLFGLCLIGMEHTLQVLIAIVCAWGIVACLRDRDVPGWCLAAAVLGPAVRYECLGLTIALGIALWGRQQRRQAYFLLLAFLPPAVAALFFHHHGLPVLPWSVLIKGSAPGLAKDPGFLLRFHLAQLSDAFGNSPTAWIVLLLALGLLGAWWKETRRPRRFALGGAFLAVALHIAIGRFGWMNRYEPYILLFAVIVVLELVWESPRAPFCWYALALLACSYFYLNGTRSLASDSSAIYRQQFQTARFLHSLPDTNVAVNDLGLVAFDRPSSQYVFDLMGLGSPQAALVSPTSAWMDEIAQRHHIGVVAVYTSWFPALPAKWIELGQECRDGWNAPGMACVHYFATGLEPVAPLRARFVAFLPTLPPHTTSTVADSPKPTLKP